MTPEMTSIITTDELYQQLQNPDVIIIDVGGVDEYEAAHIPGAVQIDYAAFVTAHPPIMGLVPEADQLALVFSSIGLKPGQQVVAYDREGGGKAGRLIFTLDAIGHTSNSLLNGGLQAWLSDAHGVETGMKPITHSQYQATLSGANIADKHYIQSRIGADDLVLLDCRTAAEFSGQDIRAARGGHIPGAVNFNWTDAIDPANSPRVHDENTLENIFQTLGMSADKEIIAYCQTHHRSSHTYVVLKQLGYKNVKGYPGAWSDWGNDPDTPIES